MSYTDPSLMGQFGYGQQPSYGYGGGGYGYQSPFPAANLLQGVQGYNRGQGPTTSAAQNGMMQGQNNNMLQNYQSPEQLALNQQYRGSSLTQGIPNMLASFGLLGNQGGINNIGKQANQSANMANALVNPGNALYQQIYGQQRKQDIGNLAQTANMLQGQNRLNAAMGRTPLFAKGREGEQAFRGLEQGYQNADLNAQQQARGVLSQGLQGSNSALSANMMANRAQQQQTGNVLGGFNTLADLFKELGGI